MQSLLKILFIDDHSGLRDGISMILSKRNSNYNFFNTDKKADALEILSNNKDIGVAVVDINLAGENGLEMIQDFRKIIPDLKIIVFTMFDDLLHVEDALKKNIQGYVTKDATIDELEEAISLVSEGKLFYNKVATEMMHSIIHKDTSAFQNSEEQDMTELFNRYKTLTQKEQEVFMYLAQEKDIYEISKILGKSDKTVANQKSLIYQKMNIADRLDVIRMAKKLGVIL
ncbi:MAG: response regulator transcription factor [Treponema sp.]|nr:response regulator transcription factor [Candidatus Treponema merdequi]